MKEGNTKDKISGIRDILTKYGYRNGYVTIDASDWFVNSELIKAIKKYGQNDSLINEYRDFYISHIIDRAKYYEALSYKINRRHIRHNLLLHHNLSSALFLKDLIVEFKKQGWNIIDADKAFKDSIYNKLPSNLPAGESLIWALAKESGMYKDELRYPAESSIYEKPKMLKLGLIIE